MAKKNADFGYENDADHVSEPLIPARIILWMTLAFLIVALIWAYFATLDVVTVGTGQVIPSSQTQIIQSLDGGILRDLLVHEGDVVNKGQILMHIDPTRYQSSYGEGKEKMLALLAKVERLTAEINSVPFTPSNNLIKQGGAQFAQNEADLYKSRQNQLQAKLAALRDLAKEKQQELLAMQASVIQLQNSFNLINKEINMTQPLIKTGAASPVDLLRLQRQAADIKNQLDNSTLGVPRLQAAVSEANNNIKAEQDGFMADALGQLGQAKADLASTTQANIALQNRVDLAAVRSPVHGIVSQINIHTVGGVVQPGMNVMTIVPLNDALEVEAKVRPSDIGFLHPGQEATVKITAYDFAIYGGLTGTLETISADTTTNEKGETFYTIKVRTQKNYLGTPEKPLTIIPGMQATVNILTEHRSVLDYLLKPIVVARESALQER